MNDDDVIIEADGSEEGGSEEELEAMESRADGKLHKVKKELEQAKKEKQEYLDGWQRAKADYVNAAKRFEEDRLQATNFGKLAVFKSFITPMDSLERAKQAGEIPEAFQAIAKQLEDAAKVHGLQQFGEVGEKFDPMLHEALGQEPAKSQEEDDTVTQVFEKGWKVGEAVIRPAKVRVASYEG
ncbi:MAG TPA: nucleotide exchange factor GrpE [Candidatus Paceibacterota bacterium]|nr:nucleotide exchange factor GrpE [Candidatus Paceibacterota bacterium]